MYIFFYIPIGYIEPKNSIKIFLEKKNFQKLFAFSKTLNELEVLG